jgi:predicted MFS family arabinose efflux permease
MSDEAALNRRTLVLALGTFAVITGNYAFIGVLGQLAGDLGVSIGLAGQLVTVFALTNLGSPILVSATSSTGRRRLLMLALFVYAVANIIVLVLPSFGWLVVARIVAGAAAAIFTPAAAALATQFVPAGREGRGLAIVNSGLAIAFAIGLPLGTAIGGAFDWRMTFVFAGGLTLVSLVALRLTLPDVQGTSQSDEGASRLTLLQQPGVILDVMLMTLAFTAIFVVQSYIGPVLGGMTGFGSGGISALQVVLGVTGVVGVIISGESADGYDTWKLLVGLFMMVSLGMVPFSVFTGAGGGTVAIVGTVAALILIGLGGFSFIPIQQYRLIQRAPEARSVALGLNAAALFFGQALGTAIGGLTIQYTSLASLGWVGAMIGGLALVVTLLSRPVGELESATTAPKTADD